MGVMLNINTSPTKPVIARSASRWDWSKIPVGASFDFEDAKPQAVISSFGAFLMRGKYSIKHLGGGRYRFWRLG